MRKLQFLTAWTLLCFVVAATGAAKSANLDELQTAFRILEKLGDSAAAREALKLRPDYSDAWNNIAAAYNSESKWDEGISAAAQAVRLRPDNQLARNNLAWAVQQKQKASGPAPSRTRQ